MTTTEAGEAKIVMDGVYKIFGDDPKSVVEALRAGTTKQALLERTGQVVAVQDATFHVAQGEIFVIMGLSGSGKSTLVRMINRLIEPTFGRILIDGQDITAMSRQQLIALRRRDIAMVFQSFALMPHLNSLENAAFGLNIAGIDAAQRTERAMKALETVGLGAYAESFPGELSGGMQQRVGLARALALEPTVLLMDEAFSALDPLIRLDMQQELLRIREARDLTVVFISHDLDEALRVGDRIAIMDDGAIIQAGTAQEIISEPANDYVRTFFGRADMAKVFTAGDLARADPTTVIRTPAADLSGLIETQGRCGHSFAFVVDHSGTFEGVVSVASIAAMGKGNSRRIAKAFLPNAPVLKGSSSLEACLGTVAEHPFDLPVTDDAGRFLGTISKSRLLKALGQRT